MHKDLCLCSAVLVQICSQICSHADKRYCELHAACAYTMQKQDLLLNIHAAAMSSSSSSSNTQQQHLAAVSSSQQQQHSAATTISSCLQVMRITINDSLLVTVGQIEPCCSLHVALAMALTDNPCYRMSTTHASRSLHCPAKMHMQC